MLRRAWHVAEALEQEHWAREIAQRGRLATCEACQALWEHLTAAILYAVAAISAGFARQRAIRSAFPA